MEPKTETKPAARNINKPAYVIFLLAGIYLVIAPFTAHAIANAFYNSEDKVNNLKNKEVEVESSDDENPFVHNINKVKEMENKSDESNDDSIKFSISTLEISEDE